LYPKTKTMLTVKHNDGLSVCLENFGGVIKIESRGNFDMFDCVSLKLILSLELIL